ncbi:hypothetical protein DY240_05640 [Jiangella rhizosphaerae]|uniref:DUF6879 domain-containing protein n=1 Tax=Jiangella rhizosphaerae TaxID=2293569 RepID=A0A418KV97_9ACTN|nr:hypothetical protein DY240_05640 [Jiangella rhizosphaerae]
MHLEMRDAYMLDDPEFIAWQRGKRYRPDDRHSWWRPWLDVVRATVDRGVVMRRARIVSEPISDYIRYEYDITFTNIAAGEQVRWLPRRQAKDLLVPGADLWVFDDTTVVFKHFTGDGQVDEPGMERVDDPSLATQCAVVFEAVWERAIPHDEYHP